ncbi:beclin 1-associated autophagy-related key regulator-like [Montipora capricornis]|uniref:beclin 1-associated autophagy-related key regulator-like n=1 Tax=Montipora capricornis TaxID=246305 RepID=UPI0035F16AD4
MAFNFQDGNDLKSPPITSPLLVCPLCNNKRKSFTCQLCIDNGNFGHCSGKYSERYCEKLRKFEDLKRLKKEFEKRVLDVLETTEETEKLNFEVISSRQQVLLLRLVVKEATEKLLSETDALSELQRSINSLKREQTEHHHKIQLKTKQLQQFQAAATKSKKELETTMDKLCKVRRYSISQIQKYIFPIEVNPVDQAFGSPPLKDCTSAKLQDIQCGIESDSNDENRQSQLAEATRTSYIEGRWVSEEEEEGDVRIECSINDACLPANGDYTAYHEWVKSHRNGSREPASDEEISMRNPAFMVTAALTYACQMMEIMAFYLDVNLPKRINYSEFCCHELNKREFRSAVDRLNTNVLHVCFTQHVEPSLLHPKRILHNLYTCVNSLHLGREGSFECHPELISISSQDNDGDQSDLSSDEEDSESDAEWENLPANLVHTTDASTVPGSMKKSSSSGNGQRTEEPGTAASLVSSAAASVAALWPWKK